MILLQFFTRLVRKLLRKKEPPLTVVEWELLPYQFKVDWFVDAEGGFVSSRKLK